VSDGFRIATAYVAVEASDEGFRAQLDAKIKEAAEGVAAKVKVTPDADGLAEKIRAEAAAADAETHIRVKVDETGGGITSELDALGSQAETEADAIGGRIGSALGNGLFRDANGYIRNASGQFASDEEKIAAGLEDLGTKADRSGQKLTGAGKSARDAGRDAGSSTGGWGALSGAAGGTATALKAVAGISLVPTLAAIPGLAAGAAAGLGVLIGAALGVAKALKDAGAATGAGGGGGPSGAQLAATAYSNAVAIRGAEQQVSDAREQAARSAVSSAESVQNAEQGVVDAERNAATAAQNSAAQIAAAKQHVVDAAYAGQQAEQAYTNAVYNEVQAQQAAINARAAAADQLVDSQNAAADAHLATEKAAQDSAAAQKALALAEANGATTADQKAALDLAARTAVQQLADAKQREKEAVEKANAATKAGVDQAPTVLAAEHAAQLAAESTVAAQHGVTQAQQQQADAAAALAKAQQAAADQQAASDEQVAKARQSLADAQRQADQQREDSAKSVARAEQNLTDTIKQQQLAASAANSGGSAGANAYAQDMKNLSQAGRDFVTTALGMKSELHELSLEAQTATLPGFTQMLKDSNHLLPVVRDGIQNTGHALSDMALGFGHLFANPQFNASAMQFEQIVTGGFGQFTSALPPLLNAIVTDGVRAAPLINAVALGVHQLIETGLPDFLSGLTVNSAGAAQGVGALFRAVAGLLGPAGMLTGAVAGALGPALDNLEPTLVTMADEIVGNLLPIMPQLSTDLVDVAQVVGQLFQAVEPVIPMLADDLATGLRIVDPLLKDLAKFLGDNQQEATTVAEGILGIIAAMKAWNTVTSITQGATKAVTGLMDKFKTSAKNAGEEAEKAGAKAGAEGFAGKVGNAIPIVGAAVTGVIALAQWYQHTQDAAHNASTSVDGFTTALLNSESNTDNVIPTLDTLSQKMTRLGADTSNAQDPIAQTGVGLIELSKKIGLTTDQMRNYDAGLAAMVSSGNGDRAAKIVSELADATDVHGNKIVDVTKDLPAYQAAIQKAGTDQLQTNRATKDGADAVQNLGDKINNTTDKYKYMSDTMNSSEALDRFHLQLLDLSKAAQDNGTSLDGNTQSGLRNRQAFSDLADQIREYGQKLKDSGDVDGDVGFKMQGLIDQLEETGKKYGYNKTQIDDYIKKIGLIPPTALTTLNQRVAFQIDQEAMAAALNNIDHVVGQHHLIPGNAAGGLITGPGTGTSDSIVRRVSNGEFIMPADSVARFGVPFMESLRNGQMPAAPTPSAAPVTVNFYGTQYPTVEQQQVLMRDLALAVRR